MSQPGEWDIALAAQRVQDLDLNYGFTAKVTNAPASHAPLGSTASMNIKSGQMSVMNSSNMTAPSASNPIRSQPPGECSHNPLKSHIKLCIFSAIYLCT